MVTEVSIKNCTGPSSRVILKFPCPVVIGAPEAGQSSEESEQT